MSIARLQHSKMSRQSLSVTKQDNLMCVNLCQGTIVAGVGPKVNPKFKTSISESCRSSGNLEMITGRMDTMSKLLVITLAENFSTIPFSMGAALSGISRRRSNRSQPQPYKLPPMNFGYEQGDYFVHRVQIVLWELGDFQGKRRATGTR